MNILEYILDNRIILIPVLIIIGQIIRQTKYIPNKFIPLILLIFGIVFSLMIEWNISIQAIIQGILITGAAVLSDQIPKQLKKKEYQYSSFLP